MTHLRIASLLLSCVLALLGAEIARAQSTPVSSGGNHVALPSAEASLRGMGGSFSAELATGGAAYSLPIALPPGRAGVTPSLTLAYHSSGGNGPLGLGWSLDVPAITRRSERGTPRYVDGALYTPAEDTFMFGGMELVPVSAELARQVDGVAAPADLTGFQQYRLRQGSPLTRLFRAPDRSRWIVQEGDGTRLELGALATDEADADMVAATDSARELGPNGEVSAWRLTRKSDAHGSTIYYFYRVDGRTPYLSDVYYLSPASCAASTPERTRRCAQPLGDYGVRIRFVYEARGDVVTSYATGYAIVLGQRLRRIEVTAAQGQPGARTLVRRYHLAYDTRSFHSLLRSVQLEGRPQALLASAGSDVGDATIAENALGDERVGVTQPALRFAYTQDDLDAGFPRLNASVQTSASSPTVGVADANAEFFDVNGDGLDDLVWTDTTRFRAANGEPAVGVFWNGFDDQGATRAGSFSAATAVAVPSEASLIELRHARTALMDLTGDGVADLLHLPRTPSYGYFVADHDAQGASPSAQGWSFQYHTQTVPSGESDPRIDLTGDSGRIRVFDVNHDGLVDVVRTAGDRLQIWLNLGHEVGSTGRFGSVTHSDGVAPLSTAPLERCLPRAGLPISFTDSNVQVADMNGDGQLDIARISPDRVVYWPGHGDGRFDTADGDCGPGAPGGGYVEMRSSTALVTAELLLSDLDMDGAADVVRVSGGTVQVWWNRGGSALSPRVIVRGAPSVRDLGGVRIADIDGSGTADVVFSAGRDLRWLDALGGTKPRLLRQVDDGLGSLRTFEYGTSRDDLLRDASGTWRQPFISTVLRAVTEDDRLSALGRESTRVRTEYAYHDPYYEGVERRWRGFGRVDERAVGDAERPTSTTRSVFLQGQRSTTAARDGRLANADEPLGGKLLRQERYDDLGLVLSTLQHSYAVRTLLDGLNGQPVQYAYVFRSDEVRYDTADPGSAASDHLELSAFVGIRHERVTAGTDGAAVDAALAEAHAIPLHGGHYAHILHTLDEVDRYGRPRQSTAHGRLRGEFGETLGDERIVQHQAHSLISAERWLFRPGASYRDGHGSSVRLGDSEPAYDPLTGDLLRITTHVTLPRRHTFAGDTRGAAAYTARAEDAVESLAHDAWGNIVARCAGADLAQGRTRCLGLETVDFDPGYADFALRTHKATARAGSDFVWLETESQWDRGLGALARTVDVAGATTITGRDGLGRVSYVQLPPVQGCEQSSVPSERYRYDLPADPAVRPLSMVETTRELSCAALGASTQRERSYIDGQGRLRARLVQAEGDHAFQRSELGVFDARGELRRSFVADFLDQTEPSPSTVLALPSTPVTTTQRDAFGRTLCTRTADGALTCTTHHALSHDLCDPLDHDPASPFYRSCGSTRMDGHGRVIDTVLRNVQPDSGTVSFVRLFRDYRADGALLGLTRSETTDGSPRATATVRGGHSVSRSFEYDSIGRLLASSDADTDTRRTGATELNRSYRYLYNRVGALIAMRDPRGCGQNHYYDLAGRQIGERYVSCAEAQAGEAPVSELAAGAIGQDATTSAVAVDARTHYDTYPSWVVGALAPDAQGPGRGRRTAVEDRGLRSVHGYDARGAETFSARQLAVIRGAPEATSSLPVPLPLPNPAEGGVSARVAFDEAHSIVVRRSYDHAGRLVGSTLPSDPLFAGSGEPPELAASLTYNERGLPDHSELHIGSTSHVLVSSVEYSADARPLHTYYGQGGAAFDASVDYDSRRRPTDLRAARTPREGGSELSAVRDVLDQHLTWDAADNLVQIEDRRDPSEWPAGFLPQTVDIAQDGLYRVVRADYTYTHESGAPDTHDAYSEVRAALATASAHDPMRPGAAPSVSAAPSARVVSLTWTHDWLGNLGDFDDDAQAFHERSLGRLTHGDTQTRGRPSALYFASDLSTRRPAHAPGVIRGGYLELDHGEGGNVLSTTVHGQCRDVSSANPCWDDSTRNVSERRSLLATRCQCAVEQHYQYRWDELNRLVEARRYDRSGARYELAARLRYRYDGEGQRTVKQALDHGDSRCSVSALPGMLELRGVSCGPEAYETSDDLASETHHLVGGARVVGGEGQPRITMPVSDLLGSSAAVVDLVSGELLEASTYYPNGARETVLTQPGEPVALEPRGFTGKEADDEVGLVYFGERYLMPKLGHWASPDPLQIHGAGGGESLNNYHYVRGNLLSARDPIGLSDERPGFTAAVTQDVKASATRNGMTYDWYYQRPIENGFSIDHVVPWSELLEKGGKHLDAERQKLLYNFRDNLQATDVKVNSSKGSRSVFSWLGLSEWGAYDGDRARAMETRVRPKVMGYLDHLLREQYGSGGPPSEARKWFRVPAGMPRFPRRERAGFIVPPSAAELGGAVRAASTAVRCSANMADQLFTGGLGGLAVETWRIGPRLLAAHALDVYAIPAAGVVALGAAVYTNYEVFNYTSNPANIAATFNLTPHAPSPLVDPPLPSAAEQQRIRTLLGGAAP